MTSRAAWLVLGVLGCSVGAVVACGSDDGKRVAADSAGAGGEAGAADPGSGGSAAGADPVTPSSGAPTMPAQGGAAGTPGEGGSGGQPADSDDIDGDGFLNGDDPDPLDPAVPGDFSSVDAILANPLVAAALDELAVLEVDLGISTEATPPDMTGFYRKPDGVGSFTQTSNGTDLGRTVVGLEHFDLLHPGGTFDSTVVGFTGPDVALTSAGLGNFVRGSGQHFSTFSRDGNVCTQGGSFYRTWSIRIVTGDQDDVTGDVVNLQVLAVTVAVAGTLTPTCELLLAGESELVGGWSLWEATLDTKVDPADLFFLCVDSDDNVHLPGASFTDAGGATCTCAGAVLTCE